MGTSTTTTTKTTKTMLTHVDRTATAYTGPAKVDATPVATLLIDLPPGAKKGLRTSGPGIDGVIAELAASVPTAGAAAGISTVLYQAFVTGTTNIEQLTAIWQVSSKLTEVVGETLAVLQDTREQQLSQLADAIQSTAKRTKNAGVTAPFQQTLAYKAQIAQKGVKTREAKKAAKAATPAATTPATTTPATTTHT
jgi:hypothetical protein